MTELFELQDIYKAIFAMAAGFVLGLERELKDKAAGLKTITIICLGSALFTIISMKVGVGTSDPGRIAANISTGIGFLGAGVIFKEGFNVYGLTTAGIIWIAAAIGMSIGFGQIALGFVFLICALAMIYSNKILSKFIIPQHSSKILTLEIPLEKYSEKEIIVNDINKISRHLDEIKLSKTNEETVSVTFELHIKNNDIQQLERYLIENKNLLSFTL